MQLGEKEKKLINNLKELGNVIIAFSGGVDSTYLAAIAYQTLREKAIAITFYPEYVPTREIEETKELAKIIGIKHKIIKLNSLSNEKIANNPPDRCFYCKTDLFSNLIEEAKKLDINYILDGSNTDDLKEYRPGLRALNNLGIISPLKEASLSKEDIRILSKQHNLPTWDKASFSCLATRIPYNDRLTKEKLTKIEKAEDLLYKMGIKQFRVRYHDNLARIEVLPDDLINIISNNSTIVNEYKKLGFKYITLDLNGYQSGSLNIDLKKAE